MPFTMLSAIFSAFFLVRVIKGHWARHPHYLGLAMIGSLVATVALARFAPGMEDDMIVGNLATFVGGAATITLFDLVMGA
ncbi:hypothetical protein CSC94_07320 [Zhengella mangrovi]|uniref:Uncharacterized protein n=1 Tax=Zhengella mangrovi TaxID=1982044 RepID=A0A2G1QPV5_9HYPH|nr:hypothetical protein [Zhengella mangrovi]PHP67509.1 hypothetical protein CSC94_07320 [Zhengella mangrovi]